MIKTHSNDPDVAVAARQAAGIIKDTLDNLPVADSFDYGGHQLKVGEYGLCERCTRPIAEAQAAEQAVLQQAATVEDETVKEHLALAAELLRIESAAAVVRAELHNGKGTEPMLNLLLGFLYERKVHDDYDHSHNPGA